MRRDAHSTRGMPVFLAMIPALLTLACSSGLVGAKSADPGEIERLKRQVVELRKRATVAELDGDRMKREIARLNAELEEARRTSRPESLAPERVEVQAEVEVEPTAPATIGLEQEVEETDLEEIKPVPAPPVVEQQPVTTPLPAASKEPPVQGSGTPPEQAEQAPTDPSQAAQALYDEGYTLFHQKRYADAEARFSRYVELYPGTNLADNALFWIGECRYARGDFSSALEAFSGTVERYPRSNKVGDALFKAGKCLESLGDTQQARRTYEEVMERFPGSSSAAQARDRLDGLR